MPKLSHGQNISKAKADPKPKLIKIKTYFNKIDQNKCRFHSIWQTPEQVYRQLIGPVFYQLWPKHKIEPHLKKESLLKFNVKLKPKLSHGQNISKAKADPNPKLIKIKTYFNKIDQNKCCFHSIWQTPKQVCRQLIGSVFLSIMAKLHKIEQHLKKDSLLKFNVKLKPKLSQRQSISKAKDDPKPKMIQIQT